MAFPLRLRLHYKATRAAGVMREKKITTGVENEYHWMVSNEEIHNLDKIITEYHSGYFLFLATFDSGPLTPNPEEIALGWKVEGEIMISPPLSSSMVIPHEQYDEWYLSECDLKFPEDLERFVNYGGFRLHEESGESEKSNSTWERNRSDDMGPIQEKFWKQLKQVNPVTFVAIGDNDIVVSKNKELVRYVVSIA